MIIMAVFGGPGTVSRARRRRVLALGHLRIAVERNHQLAGLFFGVVIVAAVVLMPRGLADMLRRFRNMGWRYFAENVRAHRL